MKIKSCFFFLTSFFLFFSCTTTKLMDSWKSPSFNSLLNAKVLVISEHPEMDVRKLYETFIVKKLRSQNINAIEAHLQFPSLEKTETPGAKTKILQKFKKEEISAIIITSLKQTIETQNGAMSIQSSIPKAYSKRASFTSIKSSENSLIVATSKTYVLEAITYNLTLEKDKQLVNVCLVDVTDPKSGDKILKSFTKIIGNQFK